MISGAADRTALFSSRFLHVAFGCMEESEYVMFNTTTHLIALGVSVKYCYSLGRRDHTGKIECKFFQHRSFFGRVYKVRNILIRFMIDDETILYRQSLVPG